MNFFEMEVCDWGFNEKMHFHYHHTPEGGKGEIKKVIRNTNSKLALILLTLAFSITKECQGNSCFSHLKHLIETC